MKPFLKGAAIGGAVLAILSLGVYREVFEPLERKSLDARFLLRGPWARETAATPLLVAIDSESLKWHGRWPWDRKKHADFIAGLREPTRRPAVLAYDVLFDQEDELHPDADQALVTALSEGDPQTVLAYFFDFPTELPFREAIPQSCDFGFEADAEVLAKIPEAASVELPFRAVCGKPRLGFVNIPLDPDGFTRRVPLFLRYQGKLYPSFDLETALAFLGLTAKDLRIEKNRLWIGSSRWVPITESGEMWVNWLGRDEMFEAHPFHELLYFFEKGSQLNSAEGLSRLKDRIVIVGLTALAFLDKRPTPFNPYAPGMVVHAHAVMNLIEGNALARYPKEVTLALALLLGILAVGGAASFPIRPSIASLTLLMGAYSGAAFWLFAKKAVWLDLVPVEFSMFFPSLGVILYRYVLEEKEKRSIKGLFRKYVSRNVLDALLKEPRQLALGGIRKKVTILFADIKSFTTYCESQPPEQVVKQLNEFFSEMTHAVFKYDGTLDKFVGDSIIAFFGAPREDPRRASALQAVSCAFEMKGRLEALQARWRETGEEVLEMGIGINTGEAIVGNIGSRQFMEYTVVGDAVNVCARIENLTRLYHAPILVTDSTYEEIKPYVEAQSLGEITVKGRREKVLVYSLKSLLEDRIAWPTGITK